MFVRETFPLEALDGLTEEVGHIGRALSFHREAHHHGLAAAEHGSRFGVHRLLRQGETALADVRHGCFDGNGVAIEDGRHEVSLDTRDDGHHVIGTIILVEHGAEIVLLAQIVISEVRIVVDVAVTVDVVETNLYGHAVMIDLRFDVLFHKV